MDNKSYPMAKLFRTLISLVSLPEKRRFMVLMGITMFLALLELCITSLVALLAMVFGSLETALQSKPLHWLQSRFSLDFFSDARLLSLAILSAIVVILVCKNIFAIFQQWHIAAFSESIGNEIRVRLLRFLLYAPFLSVQKIGTSDMLFDFNAASKIGQILLCYLQISSNVVMIITVFMGLIVVSPVPSLCFLLILAYLGCVVDRATRKLLSSRTNSVYSAELEVHDLQQMVVHSLKEMRLYGRERFVYLNYVEKLNNTLEVKKWFQALSRLPISSLEVLGFISLIAVMLFLIFVKELDVASICGVMGFMAAVAWRTLPVANRLVDMLIQARSGLPYLIKVSERITLESGVQDNSSTSNAVEGQPLAFNHRISLDSVCFRYPEASKDALHKISFSIDSGQMIGIVGLSGAGKSTLVNVLTGLMPPTSGTIRIDGCALSAENMASWLQRVGYVAQSPHIFDASLADNVAFSRWGEEIDRVRVLECCQMAACDFLKNMEDGIDTILGDCGSRLSGGQAQRVAIARALYSKPGVIIFDEATSALDEKNEKSIQDTIVELQKTATVVIIAHRLSTVSICDKVIWLESGRVRCTGNAKDVIEKYSSTLKHNSLS